VVKFGTGVSAQKLGRPAAGKTGTTSDYNDAWFIGYVPSIVTGVWVGYDDHKPIGNKETGAQAALPIWLEFMQGYVKEMNVPPEDFPVAQKPLFRELTAGQTRKDSPAEEVTEAPENGHSPSPPPPPSPPAQGQAI
jgi:penicillin-binding protein 1A